MNLKASTVQVGNVALGVSSFAGLYESLHPGADHFRRWTWVLNDYDATMTTRLKLPFVDGVFVPS